MMGARSWQDTEIRSGGKASVAILRAGREVVFEILASWRESTLQRRSMRLSKFASTAGNDSARVAAAIALLDRGYGRPVQSIHAARTIQPQ